MIRYRARQPNVLRFQTLPVNIVLLVVGAPLVLVWKVVTSLAETCKELWEETIEVARDFNG